MPPSSAEEGGGEAELLLPPPPVAAPAKSSSKIVSSSSGAKLSKDIFVDVPSHEELMATADDAGAEVSSEAPASAVNVTTDELQLIPIEDSATGSEVSEAPTEAITHESNQTTDLFELD